MQKYFNSVTNSRGDAILGARVAVSLPSGSLATIYSDNGVTVQANPMTTDGNGYFAFYAADGRYDLRITAVGIKPVILNDILLEDIGDQLTEFEERVYPGVYESPPTTRPSGAACVEGDRCTIMVGEVGYEHLRSGGVWVIPNIDATTLALATGSGKVGFVQTYLAAAESTVQKKLRESVSITDFYADGVSGALVDPTGVVDSTAGIQAALNVGGAVYAPPGEYRISDLSVIKELVLSGAGWNRTFFNFYTTTSEGMKWDGEAALGNESMGVLRDITLRYMGSGTDAKSGLKMTRKVNAVNVIVSDFSGHGVEFTSVNANTQTPYFSTLTSVRGLRNGLSGCRVSDNCNALTFINCQWNSNGEHGFHQELTTLATYNTTLIGGQASYNQKNGWYMPNCTNYNAQGIYAEYNNQSATGAAAGDTLNGTYKDVWIGDSVTYSNFHLGTMLNQQMGRVRLPNNTTSQVWQGAVAARGFPSLSLGQENQGAGRTFTFEGASGAQHAVLFREGTADIFRIRYNGTPAAPTNELLFEANNGGTWIEVMKLTNNGRISFFGAASVAKPTISAAATDATSTQALANSLRSSLISLGLVA